MFFKLSLFVAAAFVASALAGANPNAEYKCNVGSVQCCNQVQSPKSAEAMKALAILNIPVESLTGQVGAQCNPITAIGKGNGAGCAAQPTCCENVHQEQKSLVGSVGINCSPVTVIL